jgi:hypothetical protein
METTEKDRAIQALQTLPEHATIEDAIERLCLGSGSAGRRELPLGATNNNHEAHKSLEGGLRG